MTVLPFGSLGAVAHRSTSFEVAIEIGEILRGNSVSSCHCPLSRARSDRVFRLTWLRSIIRTTEDQQEFTVQCGFQSEIRGDKFGANTATARTFSNKLCTSLLSNSTVTFAWVATSAVKFVPRNIVNIRSGCHGSHKDLHSGIMLHFINRYFNCQFKNCMKSSPTTSTDFGDETIFETWSTTPVNAG